MINIIKKDFDAFKFIFVDFLWIIEKLKSDYVWFLDQKSKKNE